MLKHVELDPTFALEEQFGDDRLVLIKLFRRLRMPGICVGEARGNGTEEKPGR